MVAVVAADAVDETLALLNARGVDAWVLGGLTAR
jgi:phosphoribosylaminoimidazole (AIR) synthetase